MTKKSLPIPVFIEGTEEHKKAKRAEIETEAHARGQSVSAFLLECYEIVTLARKERNAKQ